jgi:hypothetical protein
MKRILIIASHEKMADGMKDFRMKDHVTGLV